MKLNLTPNSAIATVAMRRETAAMIAIPQASQRGEEWLESLVELDLINLLFHFGICIVQVIIYSITKLKLLLNPKVEMPTRMFVHKDE